MRDQASWLSRTGTNVTVKDGKSVLNPFLAASVTDGKAQRAGGVGTVSEL